MNNGEAYRCGFIALVGRPNTGKSTLLNKLAGHKVSIVTPKPQTTRHRITAIKTSPYAQFVFIDTPGMHKRQHHALNRYMNRAAASVLEDSDLILFVVEALKWTGDDELVLDRLSNPSYKVGLIINKIDKVRPKTLLLPYLDEVASRRKFLFIVPVSATTGENVDTLESAIYRHLPESEALYPVNQFTDQSWRTHIAELIREKLMIHLQEELPYSVAVDVEDIVDDDKVLHINAIIWVERSGQKGIVIGKNGAVLKSVGSEARLDLQKEDRRKVFLRLWVKVRENWADDEKSLKDLGLGPE